MFTLCRCRSTYLFRLIYNSLCSFNYSSIISIYYFVFLGYLLYFLLPFDLFKLFSVFTFDVFSCAFAFNPWLILCGLRSTDASFGFDFLDFFILYIYLLISNLKLVAFFYLFYPLLFFLIFLYDNNILFITDKLSLTNQIFQLLLNKNLTSFIERHLIFREYNFRSNFTQF